MTGVRPLGLTAVVSIVMVGARGLLLKGAAGGGSSPPLDPAIAYAGAADLNRLVLSEAMFLQATVNKESS